MGLLPGNLRDLIVNPLRTFGFLLKDTSRLYVERFEQRAGALGMTLPQCRVLIYPADRRARRLYLKPKGKPLVDDIWHLVALTRREAFAGIPKKHADLMIELLEKIQSNFVSLEPLQPVTAAAALERGRAGTGGARS